MGNPMMHKRENKGKIVVSATTKDIEEKADHEGDENNKRTDISAPRRRSIDHL
jgi:hypothetical protein